jgi:hypothetical protein
MFTNTIKINGIDKHILNTPYFHKQLYSDFIGTQAQEKYAGSAYLLLNSLPFKDLDDQITNFALQYFSKGVLGNESTLVSTIFREIGATHYIPYHMMLKWGSIYHRYKKWINYGVDIIANVTDRIDRNLFFDNDAGITYTGLTSGKTISESSISDVGFHPYYETIFHQIVNGYGFFNTNSAASDYANMIVSGVTKLYYQEAHEAKTWTSFINNSKFDSTDERYTLLPCNGYCYTDSTNFILADQNNFRILWDIETEYIGEDYIDYTGYTFPAYNEYFKLTGITDTYSLSTNYRKVIDLIATFKPSILEAFELAFLDFASEKLNEEIPYNPYNVTYGKFQDLLKKMVSVVATGDDLLYGNDELLKTIKEKQSEGLVNLTNEILSNNNLIKLTLSNPREVDDYVFGGFTNINVSHFSVEPYDISQITDDNKKYIELYLGEPLSGCTYYGDFFSVNDIEISEDNIKRFRPLIYVYAGLRASGETPTKLTFIDYVKNKIVNPSINEQTQVSGPIDRLGIFLDDLIRKIQSSDFNTKSNAETSFMNKRGYNDDPLKLELYDYFKSFNDKWTSGNSIGQRTLMEEFLFLDKANRDIGSSVYLNMEKLWRLEDPKNEKINLYSLISILIQDTGFDIRALPAYVNFYGTNFSNTSRIVPSKTVAQNMFGTFLDVDYQESAPKIILQYIGPTSKHLELSDISKKYMYKNDGFDIGNVNKNPIIVAPDVFTKTDFSKSNKVVAFEVSFGDQNQSIFKGVELDQSSIRNTTESFEVLERLGRSETGASTAQVDIGLFDIYRSSSYQCQVTAMGNVMIQPTMYFYLKNIPMFKGSYWITEVTHDIKTTGIQTTFKGTRIPQQSLPNPTDSFLASYRSLFDKLVARAIVKVKEEQSLSGATGTQKTIVTAAGSYSFNTDNVKISGESVIEDAGVTDYGICYNGFNPNEKDIQFVRYQGRDWLRARAVLMDGNIYKIDPTIHMNIVSRLTIGGKTLTWGDVKDLSKDQNFYVSKFDIDSHNYGIKPDDLISKYTQTEFLNPKAKAPQKYVGTTMILKTNIDVANNKYEGPISVGPKTPPVLDSQGYLAPGYGIGLSERLMRNLGLSDGDVVYFRLS